MIRKGSENRFFWGFPVWFGGVQAPRRFYQDRAGISPVSNQCEMRLKEAVRRTDTSVFLRSASPSPA